MGQLDQKLPGSEEGDRGEMRVEKKYVESVEMRFSSKGTDATALPNVVKILLQAGGG